MWRADPAAPLGLAGVGDRTDTVRVGISPPWDLWELSGDDRRARLGRIADGGITHLFVADHVSFKGGNGSDGVVQLAALSGIEPRLDLYLGVFLLALRHPVVAARQVLTLAEAAPGRLTLGVGVGGEDRNEFLACGIDPATRGRRTDACMAILRTLLDGGTVSWDDEFFQLDGVRVRSGAAGTVPITVGGRSDAAITRAGRLGDGYLGAWCSAGRLAEAFALMEQVGATDRPQPRTGPWLKGLQLWVGVGRDVDDGKRWVAKGLENFYKMPFAPFERYTPCGTAADIAAFLRPYVEAGADTLNLTPVGPSPEAEVDTIAEVAQILAAG